MKYYTEKQALEIAINSAGAAVNYINEVSSEVSGETIKTIAHGSMSKPSTFEVQKQIEAVRGLIVIQHLLPLAISGLQGETKEQLQLLSQQLTKAIRTLTATLKPHLGEGQKLEV